MDPRPVFLAALLVACSLLGTSCAEDDSAAATLDAQLKFSEADIIHFLARTHFGARTGDIEEVINSRTDPLVLRQNPHSVPSEGLPAYVDKMLNYPTVNLFGSDDQVQDDAYDATVPDRRFPSESELARWHLYMMIHTDNPLQEHLALFWHDLFATSSQVLSNEQRYWIFDHINLFRTKGNSNLRQLLFEMSIDWAMLRWLDGLSSTDSRPNENFAREFYELFTLGVDNGYTQNDIVETSRAFTGFDTQTNPFGQTTVIFDPTRHDPTQKTIFGVTVNGRDGADAYLEYLDMVNHTLENRDVAEFICRRLFEYYVYSNPETEIVDRLAQELRENDWELRPVLRMIFTSQAFYGAKAKRGLIKSPLEFAVGFIRSTGLEIPLSTLDSRLSTIGQRPTQPPNVNGWPKGTLWLSAQGLLERTNLISQNITQRSFQAGSGITLDAILPAPSQRSAENVLRTLIRLLGVTPTEAEFNRYLNYLNTDYDDNGTPAIIGDDIVFSQPFDGNDATQISKKVRGLLYILAEHPSYHVR